MTTQVERDCLWSFHRSAHKQVPRLRIAIGKANRNAPLGMTDFGEVGAVNSRRGERSEVGALSLAQGYQRIDFDRPVGGHVTGEQG